MAELVVRIGYMNAHRQREIARARVRWRSTGQHRDATAMITTPLRIRWLWSWGGISVGYREGDELWTHTGRHAGHFRGNDAYDPNGGHLGEIRNGVRLVTDARKLAQRCHSAWGSDADRRNKRLMPFRLQGSHFHACLQANPLYSPSSI